MKFLDYAAYIIARLFLFLVGLLPAAAGVAVITALAKLVLFFRPRYRDIAMKNLTQVFPEQDEVWREKIYGESIKSIGRLVYDFTRAHKVSREWLDRHVAFPTRTDVDRSLRAPGRNSAIFVTAHLGSFELLARFVNHAGYPHTFIVRNFKNDFLDRWWNERRKVHGNGVINRQGAMKQVLRTLDRGDTVAILFDQNTTRNNAVFVDLFGRPAATTKAVGAAAVRADAVVHVITMAHTGDDNYRADWEVCDCADIYANTNLDSDEKILEVTRRVTRVFEKMIRNNPAGWFWIHRRWKTAPEGVPENFYEKVQGF